MRVLPLSPVSAMSLAGLLLFLTPYLVSAVEGAEGTPTVTMSPETEATTSTEQTPATATEQAQPTSTEQAATATFTSGPSPTDETPANAASPQPSGTSSATISATPTSVSSTASPSLTASGTLTLEPSATGSPSATATAPSTPATLPPTEPPTPYAAQSILINEIAWAGTFASATDEWIELHNPGASAINLAGWHLSDRADINVTLSGTIPAFSFFLLERTDDSSISDIAADQIYTGSLSNSGERLELTDPAANVVDTANSGGGGWPAGESTTRRSMERRGGSDIPGNWGTFTGFGAAGQDAAGNPIAGTPRRLNSILTPTATPSPAIAPTSIPAQAVLINEIAWSGTSASSSDEWIELHNPTAGDIDLGGWTLTDGSNIAVSLAGVLPAHGFYLLERTDDSTVSDLAADRIYTGALKDSGEILHLRGPSGELVDSANADGGGWPAGGNSPKASMERRGGPDSSGNWGSFTGFHGNGLDASGNPIRGTPRRTNSLFFPTPTPTAVPSRIVINEVLIRPRHDWEGTGGVTTADEFIELYNAGPLPVFLRGWWLDDVANAGSRPYDLPGVTISPHGYAVFFRTKTKIALNDTGDTVRLLAPGGQIIDRISYLRIRAANLSYGRLPDGSDNMRYGLWPTPRKPNLLFEETVVAVGIGTFFPPECTGRLLVTLERASRHPAQVAWLRGMYLVGCEGGPENREV